MNRINGLLIVITCLLSACSDDNESRGVPSHRPTLTSIILTENINSDAQNVLKTEEYLYSKETLTSHHITQEFYDQKMTGEKQTLTLQNTLTYSGLSVTLEEEGVGTYTYTLNEEGYASSCVCQTAHQKREYQFTYTKGYLTKLTERIEGKEYSSVSLNYTDGDLFSVTAYNNNIENTLNYTPGTDVNIYGLPCLTLLDTYPLSLHIDAWYAGLLGKPTQHLVTEVTPEENPNEITTYTYIITPEGKPTQIRKSTSDNGYYYSDFPNSRTIAIEIN